MTEPLSFSYGRITPRQCPVGKTPSEMDAPQERLRVYIRVDPSLIDKRAAGHGVIERKRLFQMRLR